MRVLHLIHDTGQGGVQAVAASLRARAADPQADAQMRYRLAAFARAREGTEMVRPDLVGTGLCGVRGVLRLARALLRRRGGPDVWVTSLWRSVALAAVLRALGARTPWVVWVHSSRITSLPDLIAHRYALPRADLVLCDSRSAHQELVSPLLEAHRCSIPVRVITPDVQVLQHGTGPAPSPTTPLRLISWGRLHPAKNLTAAIDLLAVLDRDWPGGAQLTVLGPDDGDREHLLTSARRRGLADRVHLPGPADRHGIAREAARAHLFVQTSRFEGFSMAAHEALASGLICVLTPVGDLAHTTQDGIDAIHHHGDAEETAARLLPLLGDDRARRAMSRRAAAHQHPDPWDALVEALTDVTSARAAARHSRALRTSAPVRKRGRS